MRKKAGKREAALLKLQDLSLICTNIGPHPEMIINAFNFRALRSLKLWCCVAAAPLLAKLGELDVLPLQTLEIVQKEHIFEDWADGNDRVVDPTVPDPVPRFLDKLPKLKQLYLNFDWTTAWPHIGSAIANRTALRQLIVESVGFSCLHSRLSMEKWREWSTWMTKAMGHSNLECIGSNCWPWMLVSPNHHIDRPDWPWGVSA